jgi:hypothetical protein
MKPTSSNLWASTFVASIFSSNVLWSFYFLGFAVGLTCTLCSIMSLLTPIRSEVAHAKASLFLSRKANNSTFSSAAISVPRQIVLSGTLGSRGIFLVSPSASMACLDSAGAL